MTISTRDFASTLGISYRDVDYWTRRGVFVPSVAAAGSGSQRYYDEREARLGRVIVSLRQHGMDLDALGRVAATLRAWSDDEWIGHLFITADGEVLREPRSPCWWFDLRVVDDERVSA